MTDMFRRNLNLFIAAGLAAFFVSFTAASIQWYRINDNWLESYFYPVSTDYSFTNWQQAADGTWSAVVFITKVRPECVFVQSQIETVLGTIPNGEVRESTVSYVQDATPGGNRVTGFQRLDDRFRIDDPAFVEGTVFRGSVLHVCTPGRYTVTEFGPFTVGVDSISGGDSPKILL